MIYLALCAAFSFALVATFGPDAKKTITLSHRAIFWLGFFGTSVGLLIAHFGGV